MIDIKIKLLRVKDTYLTICKVILFDFLIENLSQSFEIAIIYNIFNSSGEWLIILRMNVFFNTPDFEQDLDLHSSHW